MNAPHSHQDSPYRWPAEWEPQKRVWVVPPHNPDTWPGQGVLDNAKRQFDYFLKQLEKSVTVAILENAPAQTDDSWVRDYGPIFVKDQTSPTPQTVAHDFQFNGHGKKFPHAKDNAATEKIIANAGCERIQHDMVLEAGAVETNGQGVLMTTESCLLHPSRNPHLRQKQIEDALHAALGTSHTLWLTGPLTGDDTDGHIDTLARFISPDTISLPRTNPNHPDHKRLERNWERLHFARDIHGKPFNRIALPVPAPIHFTYPPPQDRPHQPGTQQLPATYTNFLISNGRLFLPTYNQPNDEDAIETLADAMPDHEIVPIPSDTLIVGMGALHCLTMHETA